MQISPALPAIFQIKESRTYLLTQVDACLYSTSQCQFAFPEDNYLTSLAKTPLPTKVNCSCCVVTVLQPWCFSNLGDAKVWSLNNLPSISSGSRLKTENKMLTSAEEGGGGGKQLISHWIILFFTPSGLSSKIPKSSREGDEAAALLINPKWLWCGSDRWKSCLEHDFFFFFCKLIFITSAPLNRPGHSSVHVMRY